MLPFLRFNRVIHSDAHLIVSWFCCTGNPGWVEVQGNCEGDGGKAEIRGQDPLCKGQGSQEAKGQSSKAGWRCLNIGGIM